MTKKKRLHRRPMITSIPEIGFMRIRHVLQFIPVGKSTWEIGVKEGRFPQPVKLGKRAIAWRATDIRKLIENNFIWEENNE